MQHRLLPAECEAAAEGGDAKGASSWSSVPATRPEFGADRSGGGRTSGPWGPGCSQPSGPALLRPLRPAGPAGGWSAVELSSKCFPLSRRRSCVILKNVSAGRECVHQLTEGRQGASWRSSELWSRSAQPPARFHHSATEGSGASFPASWCLRLRL